MYTKPILELAVDSHAGVYAPQVFASQFRYESANADDWNILLCGPDHANYWGAWEQVVEDWRCVTPDGVCLRILESDGDIWLADADAPEGTYEGMS